MDDQERMPLLFQTHRLHHVHGIDMHLTAFLTDMELWPALTRDQPLMLYRRYERNKLKKMLMEEASIRWQLEYKLGKKGKLFLKTNRDKLNTTGFIELAFQAHFGIVPFYKAMDDTLTDRICNVKKDIRCRTRKGNYITKFELKFGKGEFKACKYTHQDWAAQITTEVASQRCPGCQESYTTQEHALWHVCSQCTGGYDDAMEGG